MRSVGQTALMAEMIKTYKILLGKMNESDHLEDLGIDGRIILRRTIKPSRVISRIRWSEETNVF
jgi:hypothetical protein